MYSKYIKRLFDFFLSFIAIVVLFPLLLLLTIIGIVAMNGNPFFTQHRPGKNEKIFKLIKFRTMNNKKNKEGILLPDEDRLTSYGKFLRRTSLDELPELFNIFIGDMSLVGPRPLLVKYLRLYNTEQHRRHEVRPGLTGLAQVNGRNSISWEEKFGYDIEYVNNVSFLVDVRIIIQTIKYVVKRQGINSETCATMEEFKGSIIDLK